MLHVWYLVLKPDQGTRAPSSALSAGSQPGLFGWLNKSVNKALRRVGLIAVGSVCHIGRPVMALLSLRGLCVERTVRARRAP